MDKGRIIFLNGVTSSGKTSIVEAMQTYSEPFFYVVANDLLKIRLVINTYKIITGSI